MRLVITDTGYIWNKDNPFLKRFKDIVLVVCLNGERVTDEYECFLTPYINRSSRADYAGLESRRYKALKSVADNLSRHLGYHEDIVFLADSEPTTLYPFYVVKDIIKHSRLHLVAFSVSDSETEERVRVFGDLLSDLSHLDSFLLYDPSRTNDNTKKAIHEADHDFLVNDLGEMMPCFLNGIYHMEARPCYFDFSSMKYISLRSGYESIDNKNGVKIDTKIDFPLTRVLRMLGLCIPPSYPEKDDRTKEEIERPVVRLDGKKICNYLRKQRIRLAEANGIAFESAVCPSIGPCAGTCEKCDKEAVYISEEMRKIPVEKRIYPTFDPREVMV